CRRRFQSSARGQDPRVRRQDPRRARRDRRGDRARARTRPWRPRARLTRRRDVAADTSAPPERRTFRYYDLLLAGFVAVLLCSNLIGPAKVAEVTLPLVGATLVFGAGNLFFPVSYVFGDVLTEVYGYARMRRAIWAGAAAMVFASAMSAGVIALPASPQEPFNTELQPALETVFGNTWRVVVASVLGFWAGDFVNAYVMAKMKIATRGRWLWMRTIGST